MRVQFRHMLVACVIGFNGVVQAQDTQSAEIQALREEVRQMRTEYEARITDLESRLETAERSAAEAQASAQTAKLAAQEASEIAIETRPAPSAPSTVSVASDNAFNPAIGATFQGQAWAYSKDPEDWSIPGFPLGGEAGLAPEGLSLAETEVSMSANVDDKFTAMLTVPIVVEDGEVVVELEEAWIETLALPGGFSLRMGRFFSDIGYLNDKHFHSWDFADQPLVYQAFLGNQYIDDGVQVRWLAPTDFYLELSGELTRGDRYPAGGAANSGVGVYTLTAKTGGDVGFSNSWLAGLSLLSADANGRESGSEEEPMAFDGKSDLYIADFVWKWAPNGNSRQRNFKFQAEYMWRDEKGFYTLPDGDGNPWDNGQRGWYAQAIFQPFPRWRFGARYDWLKADQPSPEFIGTPLYTLSDNPTRVSLMVDWSNSEFSRLRLQYNHDQANSEDDNQLGFQYIFSIGAHGAHSF